MIKNYSLILIAFLCFVVSGFGQITEGFETGLPTGYTPTTSYTLSSGTWVGSPNQVIENNNLANVQSGTKSLQLRNQTGSEIYSPLIMTGGLGTVTFYSKSSTATGGVQVNYRINGGAWIPATGSPFSITSTMTQYTATINNASNNIEFQFYRTASTVYIDNVVTTTFGSTVTADYCNLQNPQNGTVEAGEPFNIQGRVYEGGLTDTTNGMAATGITAWIGYSLINATTTTDFNSANWTWVPATFLAETNGGNNDEYQADLGAAILTPGTYYYVSRFSISGGPYTYGGFDMGGGNGFWDPTNDVSGVLTVTPAILDFYNLQFPQNGSIITGGTYDVYAQAYETGVTEAAGRGNDVVAWIGYSTINATTTADFNSANWTWVLAPYVGQNGPFGNNDEFRLNLGAQIGAPGTYYYVSRFRYNSGNYLYGGFDIGGGNGAWDGSTDVSGILTVSNPPLANVVITEIMYNTSGIDDEWIEICNISGSNQNISNYTVRIGATTAFTFPASTNIANGACITVSLGSNGDGIFNNACPFTPTYGIGASTNNTNNLVNSSNTISLYSSDGTSIADTVTYNSSNGGDGNDASLHVINATLNNSNTNTNWQEVVDGGSPGTNSLVSPCSKPELQLQNSAGTNQTCGAFTINFGSQATGFNTDITFDIDNIGTLPLNVTSLVLGGANPGDYSIVSPVTFPFTVNAGATQTVTVRFLPTVVGVRTATITINNNDADEGACVVNLQGTGTTPAPEIDIERNTNATIPTGSAASLGYNTIFGTTTIGNSTAPKSYYIHNEGTANLTVTSLTSSNATEFPIITSISFPLTIAPGSLVLFEIQFSPTSAAPPTRTSVITILSNDNDEPSYTFNVQGTADCAATALTISPSSGPVGTVITVQGTNFGGSTSATINGTSTNVFVLSTTVIEVTVLAGTTTGSLEVVNQLGCKSSILFTVINNLITSCEGTGTIPSNLFISEVTDHGSGSHSYVEIFNGTGSAVNLTGYELRIHNNGAGTATNTIVLSGTVANNDVFVVAFGSTDATNPYATHGYDQFSNVSGINEDDNIRLYNGATWVDLWGETTGNTFTIVSKNYTYRRKNTGITAPSTTWNPNDWNAFTPVDYTDIGTYDFSVGVPPTVTLQPTPPTSNCDLTATLTVAGAEGYNGAGDTRELAYQWFYNAPGTSTWVEILSSNTAYTGQQSEVLNILNTLNLNNYQYYCQVRENNATCYKASNAVRLTVQKSTWTAGGWVPSAPTIYDIAVIDADYTTNATNGSFSACQLLVNATRTLTISDNYFVEVENNVINNGIIEVRTKGSFVQNQNGAAAGTFTNNGVAKVLKQTANFNDDGYNLHYTYWSSPVNDPSNPSANPDIPAFAQDITTVFANPAGNRRFYFNASNFIDSFAETGNLNQANPGHDDIDDNYNDWQVASGPMEVGRGYAVTATSPPAVPTPFPYNNTAEFSGAFNTGDITVKLYKNNNEVEDNNWNFIGNPYPSAISVNKFFDANVTNFPVTPTTNPAEGAIFLWSQAQPPLNTNNGNEGYNFSQSDYAVINRVTQTAGASGITPLRYIPSGQGFFITYKENLAPGSNSNTITKGDIIFTNSMREKSNNTQFFRNHLNSEYSNDQGRNADDTNILWLNLSSDNGVFNQIAVAYVAEATDGYDGWSYDTPRNLSSGAHAELYSIIRNEGSRFSIQAKNSNSLDIEEVIFLGFSTGINVATIYKLSIPQLEGDFLTQNTIYLKDNLLNTYHNLSQADYNFTSETGEFNERFEIVFRAETLSVGENEITPNGLSIIELNDGRVKFSVNSNLTIQSVEIIDLLGRTLYQLKGTHATEIYNLSNLSQAAYIAKVELSNGQTITKRAIKRQ